MITTRRVVRYMPPVENMSGKFDAASKRAGNGQKLYIGTNTYRKGQVTQGFHLTTKKFAYLSPETMAQAARNQAKFKAVVASTSARLKNPSTIDDDRMAFRNQSKYATMWGYVFADEWNNYQG